MRLATAVILVCLCMTVPLRADNAGPFSELPAVVSHDTLIVSFLYGSFLTEDDSVALVEGEDLALICRLELWQKRKMWFDRLRLTDIKYFTISYDRWDQKFLLLYEDDEGWEMTERFPYLDSLLLHMEREIPFIFPLKSSDLDRTSYLAYSVEIDYLTEEQLDEIADWLREGRSRPGTSKSLPDKVVGYLLKSSGLRNRSHLRTSQDFRLSESENRIKF